MTILNFFNLGRKVEYNDLEHFFSMGPDELLGVHAKFDNNRWDSGCLLYLLKCEFWTLESSGNN